MNDRVDMPDARRERLASLLGRDDFRPASSVARLDIGARSHRGTRLTNEDHYAVICLGRYQEIVMTSLPRGDVPDRFDEHGYAMAVADGLGDDGSGSVASRIALSALLNLVIEFGHWSVRIDPAVVDELKERFGWYYRHAATAVVGVARRHPGLQGMATTVTAAYVAGEDLFVAHAGHSRVYLFRDGALTQLTRDHTVARQIETSGRPTSVDRRVRDLRHMLTSALGGNIDAPVVDVEHFRLLDGDAILLCTNGLTDALSDERLADVLALRRASSEQCQLLVELAREAGTQDNATAVLAQYDFARDELSNDENATGERCSR